MNRKMMALIAAMLVLSVESMAQDYTHKAYLKGGLGYGLGLARGDIVRIIETVYGKDTQEFGFPPGSCYAPSISFGKNIYGNFSAHLTMTYLLNFSYQNVNGLETSFGFSRFGIMAEGNYFLTLKKDVIALVPTVGIGMFFPGQYFAKAPGFEQSIYYNAAPAFRGGLEFQRQWRGKFSAGFGAYYQVEKYTAKSVRWGQMSDQHDSGLNLNASHIAITATLIYPLVQNTRMGSMKNVFRK